MVSLATLVVGAMFMKTAISLRLQTWGTSSYRHTQKYMTEILEAERNTRGLPDSIYVRTDGQQKQKVTYAIFTSAGPKYRRSLEAVLTTWGSPIAAEGRLIVVGGKDYPQSEHVTNVDCADDVSGLSCKEANLIARGFDRGTAWLFITGEDHYVDTNRVEKILYGLNSSIPVAFGCVGCGGGAFPNLTFVQRSGGMCGGCGYAISRSALRKLMEKGRDAMIQEYGTETQCDMSTSNALMARGVPLESFPGPLNGAGLFRIEEYNQNDLTYHPSVPLIMQWLHAMKNNATNASKLEALAFTNGCATSMAEEEPFWEKHINACLESASRTTR